jgi:hypothetical protein
MYRLALEAADHALALCEAAIDRHIGRPARKMLVRLASLALFATPIVWALSGFSLDGRAACGLVAGLALYAALLGLGPASRRLRARVGAAIKEMFRSRA